MTTKLTRTMPDGSALHITLDASRGYFSVTADWPSQRACGCLHEEVLQAMPEVAPLVALHLSDLRTGAPMHDVANGFWWAEGAGSLGLAARNGQSQEQCLQFLADHLRVPLGQAAALADGVMRRDPKEGRAWFSAQVDAMRPRWAAEAAAGRALLDHFRKHA